MSEVKRERVERRGNLEEGPTNGEPLGSPSIGNQLLGSRRQVMLLM